MTCGVKRWLTRGAGGGGSYDLQGEARVDKRSKGRNKA